MNRIMAAISRVVSGALILLVRAYQVVLSPHLGGWSPEALDASVQRFLDNALGHFSGQGVVSVVQ